MSERPDIRVQDRVVVAFASDDGSDGALRGHVIHVTDEVLWLDVSVREADPGQPALAPGHPLRLTVQTPDRTWGADSTEVAVWSGRSGQVLLLVVRPVAATPIQRRQAMRVEVPATARVRALGPQPDAPAEIDAVEAPVRNLSAGGVLVDADLGLQIGDRAMLTVTLPPDLSFATEAEAVRVERPPRERAGTAAVAFRFLGLTERDQDRIVHRLFEIQRERRAGHPVAAGRATPVSSEGRDARGPGAAPRSVNPPGRAP